MKLSRLALVSIVVPTLGYAQLLSFGVQGGVPAQTPLGTGNSKMPFAIGPTVTIGLPVNLSLESGVLFYRLGDRNQNVFLLFPENSLTLGANRWRGRSVELPLVMKYHLLSPSRTWRPFIAAGAAVRRTSVDYSGYTSVLAGSALTSATSNQGNTVRWNLDPVLGAGLSFRTGRLHIEPEARYSYWGAGKNGPIRQNQVNFLLGFRF